MKKTYYLILIALLTVGLSACKKDSKPQIPASLIGKWYIRQYTLTGTTNNITGSPYTFFRSDTATSVYYQFNSNGTGIEQTNFDPAFVTIPPTGFNYHVSGSNIVFSPNSATLQSSTCSFEMPTSTTLIIRSNYSYSDNFGNVINNLQVLNLGK